MMRLGVLVSGNGSNLQAILDAVAAGRIKGDVCLVISNQPGVKALERANQAGVRAAAIPHKAFPTRAAFDAALVEALKAEQVDWVVLAGFMRLLTQDFLDAFPNRIINLHPSLLPAFPGVNSGQQALDYGVKVTGCTVHLVSETMDAGPIIAQQAVPVLDDDDESSLMARVHEAEHALLVDVLARICDQRLELVSSAQDGRAKVRFRRQAE